jgi:hypothetical protein
MPCNGLVKKLEDEVLEQKEVHWRREKFYCKATRKRPDTVKKPWKDPCSYSFIQDTPAL